MSLPLQPSPHGRFNEHRNTSRVFPVPPDALPAALRALRGIDPALRRWIEDGHPTLTEGEHFRRFGESYNGKPRRGREDAQAAKGTGS